LRKTQRRKTGLTTSKGRLRSFRKEEEKTGHDTRGRIEEKGVVMRDKTGHGEEERYSGERGGRGRKSLTFALC
jgi:hypothetical protein